MKQKINVVETYKFDTEAEVEVFIEQCKQEAFNGGYTLGAYSSTLKEKKSKGEVVDSGFLVKISKDYSSFWSGCAF